MTRIKADVCIDSDQTARNTYMLICPHCRQKLADIESIQGIISIRFRCRRCGKYIQAEVMGVS